MKLEWSILFLELMLDPPPRLHDETPPQNRCVETAKASTAKASTAKASTAKASTAKASRTTGGAIKKSAAQTKPRRKASPSQRPPLTATSRRKAPQISTQNSARPSQDC